MKNDSSCPFVVPSPPCELRRRMRNATLSRNCIPKKWFRVTQIEWMQIWSIQCMYAVCECVGSKTNQNVIKFRLCSSPLLTKKRQIKCNQKLFPSISTRVYRRRWRRQTSKQFYFLHHPLTQTLTHAHACIYSPTYWITRNVHCNRICIDQHRQTSPKQIENYCLHNGECPEMQMPFAAWNMNKLFPYLWLRTRWR